MLKPVLGFLVTALLSSTVFAQGSSSQKWPRETQTTTAKGFRAAFVKPNLMGKNKGTFRNETITATWTAPETTGVSFGYINAPVGEIGWTSNLTVLEMRNSASTNIARIDGSATYGLQKNIFLKGGLNLAKPINTSNDGRYTMGFGYQMGAGIQIAKNVGFDFGFTSMNTSTQTEVYTNDFSSVIGKADVNVNMSGFEMGINGTF